MLAFIIIQTDYGQVNIKEKIIINPQDSTSKHFGTAANENIWDSYGTRVGTITIPRNSEVVISYYSSDGTYQHNLYLNDKLIVTDAINYFFPYSTCTDSGETLDVSLFMLGPYNIWQTDKAYVQSYNSNSEYRVYFEDYNDYDYNDLIIDVKLSDIQDVRLLVDPLIDYTFPNWQNWFYYEVNYFDCNSAPPGFKIYASIINGDNYGNLYDPYTGETGKNIQVGSEQMLNGYLEFIPDGIEPFMDDTVKIRILTTEPNLGSEDISLIIKPGNLNISFIPSTIEPGDTADIILMKINPDGILSQIPSEQSFDAFIIEGTDYGTLYYPDWDWTSNEMWGVPQGIKFIAEKGINENSVKSVIRINTSLFDMPDKIAITNVDTAKIDINKKFYENPIRNNITKELIKKIPAKIIHKMIPEKSDVIKNYAASYKSVNIGDKTLETGLEFLERQLWGKEVINIEKRNIIAYFDKDTLHTGDTTNIIIKYVDTNGNERDYPDTTHFEIGIVRGCGLGEILDENGTKGEFFSSLKAPLRFVVNDSIDVDSASIVLKFGAPDMKENTQSPSAKIIQNRGEKNPNNNSKQLQLFKGKKITTVSGENACSVNEYKNEKTVEESKLLIGTQLVIISPTKDSPNETITADPRMPNVVCRARMKNYNGGTVTFKWEYGVTYELRRQTVKGVNMCSRSGSIVFQGVSYAKNEGTTYWNVPFLKDSIKYISLVGKKYKNTNYCTDTSKSWDEADEIFIGGKVYVNVMAYDSKGQFIGLVDSPPGNGNKILGDCPSITKIKNYITDKKIWAIIEFESSYLQFERENTSDEPYKVVGMPRYGPPNGFGLMQIDNYDVNGIAHYASESELWHWEKNIDRGVFIFKGKVAKAQNYLKKFYKSTIPDEILLHEAYQEYNGGNFYKKFNKDTGKWISDRGKDAYGNKVYNIYDGF